MSSLFAFALLSPTLLSNVNFHGFFFTLVLLSFIWIWLSSSLSVLSPSLSISCSSSHMPSSSFFPNKLSSPSQSSLPIPDQLPKSNSDSLTLLFSPSLPLSLSLPNGFSFSFSASKLVWSPSPFSSFHWPFSIDSLPGSSKGRRSHFSSKLRCSFLSPSFPPSLLTVYTGISHSFFTTIWTNFSQWDLSLPVPPLSPRFLTRTRSSTSMSRPYTFLSYRVFPFRAAFWAMRMAFCSDSFHLFTYVSCDSLILRFSKPNIRSIGSLEFRPNIKKKGVWPVDLQIVLLYANDSFGSSAFQLLL